MIRWTRRLIIQVQRISQARNQQAALLVICFTIVSFVAYSLTLKMEAIYSSETLFEFKQAIRHYVIEDGIIHGFYF
jgi:hypothetical protein